MQKVKFQTHLSKHNLKDSNEIVDSSTTTKVTTGQPPSKTVHFPNEIVKCKVCNIEMRKDSINRHMNTKHSNNNIHCQSICVDSRKAIFMVLKNKSDQRFPIHMQKLLHRREPRMFCENKDWRVYFDVAVTSEKNNVLCKHLKYVEENSYLHYKGNGVQ